VQPFIAVILAIVLLSEALEPLEIAGGGLILAGIAFERVRHRRTAPSPVPD
jgi:drug/metabolite transporter (DMT)-like permease